VSLSDALIREIDAQHRQLNAAMAELGLTAEFARTAFRLRPRLNPMLSWGILQDDDKGLVQNFLDGGGANQAAFFNGLSLVAYGVYENFVVELVGRSALVMARHAGRFDEYPLCDEHIFRTGQALRSIKGRRREGFDYFLLAKNLATCVPGNQAFTINHHVFADDRGSMDVDQIDNLFKRLGLDLDWDRFGAVPDLQDLLGRSGTRNCTNETKRFLNSAVAVRNKIAHTGTGDVDAGMGVHKLMRFYPIFLAVLVTTVGHSLDRM
jgi:hypothetical protein